MGYSMRSFFIFTSFIFAGTFLLQAEENKAVLLKTHKHRKAKFSLSYPSDWIEKADADGIAFGVNAPDGKAGVQIRTETVKGKTTACDLLIQLEGAGADAKKNVIPEDKRKPRAEELSAAGVRDGCIGAYRLMQGETEMLQGVGVYVNGRNAWILLQNLQAAARDTHGKAVSEIAKSFVAR